SAPDEWRHAQARQPGTDPGDGPRHHPDGRAVLRARHSDTAADGKRSSRSLAGQRSARRQRKEGRAVHHPRPGRSHCHERSCGDPECWPCRASDWRIRHRHRTPARCGRGQNDTTLHRAAPGHLECLARRSAQGLSATIAESGLTMWNLIKPRAATLRLWQLSLLVAVIGFWYVMTKPGLIPPMMFDNDRQAAFFFGEPIEVAKRIWVWFVTDADIYNHLGITLTETLLA